ncbi:septum formation initiator family protein [Aneurinibacillus sp. Ricciae_BoGa-3]|uniref:FtsB family cell division protein n=1 Tax=Aneurinibacillus sp. Ricciae_BoGa-3 TaxID=3022697 RepID=UPI0023417DFE|nr:septum formation initiator family protein [Aneurinibacillus sp. Ricciae_BoGa-3]WCK54639.1 septum formation initiator family protein [Aneurinibacillus sp. Ricciae_BoGa-3]
MQVSSTGNQGLKRRMRLLLFVVAVFVVWGAFTYFSQSKQLADKESKLSDLTHQAEVAKAEKSQLEQKVKQLNNSEYIGELARKNLLLSKKGEVIFLTPDTGQK